jgi:hypothetical protein
MLSAGDFTSEFERFIVPLASIFLPRPPVQA